MTRILLISFICLGASLMVSIVLGKLIAFGMGEPPNPFETFENATGFPSQSPVAGGDASLPCIAAIPLPPVNQLPAAIDGGPRLMPAGEPSEGTVVIIPFRSRA